MQVFDSGLRCRTLWLVTGYLLVGLVIYLSVTSQPPRVDLGFPHQDKLSHALAYFVLMGWFAQIYHDHKRRLYYAAVFVLMGVTLEYVQSLGHARLFEVADMVANTLGVGLALLLSLYTEFQFWLLKCERRILKNTKRIR